MKKNLTISEAFIIFLGLIIKIIIGRHVNINSFISLSYSSTDSWETILETNALANSNLNIYDGDSIHQPPLILLFWQVVIKLTNNYELLFFYIIDILCIYVTLKLSNEVILYFLKMQEKLTIKEDSLKINIKDLGSLRLILCLWHAFNPFLGISILSQSITCLNNLIFLLLFLNIVKERYLISAGLCGILTYINVYPSLFLLVILIGATKTQKKQSIFGIIITFACTLFVLLSVSYWMSGDKFISSVYWHHFRLDDSNPQINLYWYMMATMFDHFRLFFKCTFQLLLVTVCGGLAAKYSNDRVFLTYMLAWTITVLKPYPALGELGQVLALFPLYRHLFQYLRFGIVTGVMLLCVLVLGPLMHYLWMVSGTANANFYFAITLLCCAAQSHLVSSILSAYLKFFFHMKHGSNLKFSNGSEVKLSAK